MRISLAFLLAFCCFMPSCVTRYYLVRHAEKACEDCFSCGLSQEGMARAATLADSLIHKGIDQIFASQCLRTQATAEPLAAQTGLMVTLYHTDQLSSFIQSLKSIEDRRDILIVGHSNQIPVIIDSLTNVKITIGSEDYDDLFIVRKKKFHSVSAKLETETYGIPTP